MASHDVAYNFIQRWNQHKDFIGESNYPYLHPIPELKTSESPGTCTCQVQFMCTIGILKL